MRESDGRVHKVPTAAGGRAAIGRAMAAFGGALLLGASSFGVPALAAAPRLPCPSQWTQIPTEDPPNGNNPSASAVSFGSQSDGWLVGGQTNGNNVILPFAEYWDADDQSWHFGNPLLPPGAHGDVRLGGVISFAASEDQPAEAWGVGHQAGGLLLEHWLGPDPGSPWQVATPASLPPGSAFLTAVAGASRNDLWAVGYSFVDSSKNGTSTLSALISRYDGSSWNVVPAPALGDDIVGSGLIDVSAASASDVWAVGYQTDGEGYRTLIEHYDGNAWSAVSDSPNPGSAYDVLLGVWAAGDDVWAVGYRSSGTSYSPLVLHYDGSHWNVIANTPGATLQSGFRSVAEVASSGQVAAAGFDFSADAGNYIPFSVAWPKSQPDDTTALPPAASAGRTIGSEFRDLTVVPGADRLWTVGEPAVVETLCLGEAAPAPKVAATSMQTISRGPPLGGKADRDRDQLRRWSHALRPYAAANGLVVASDISSQAFLGGIAPTNTFGAAVGDFAGPDGPGPDGYQDFELGRHGSGPLQLWVSQQNGTFAQIDEGDFPKADRHRCAWGDVGSPNSPGADGLPDLFCGIGGDKGFGLKSNELWIQQPDGSFAQPPYGPSYPDMAVMDPFGRSHSPVFFYPGDTSAQGPHPLSLFVGEGIPQRGDGIPDPNRFFLNVGGVLESTPAAGLDRQVGGYRCAQSVDYDRDHYNDLLLCTQNPIGLALYHNDGSGQDGIPHFSNVTAAAGVDSKNAQFGLFTDLNGDGCDDLVVVARTSLDVELQATSDGSCLGTFASAWKRPLVAGLWAASGDVNGDGAADLYVLQTKTSPDLMLINNGDGTSYSSVPMPQATSGSGDAVSAITNALTGLADFLVLNGNGKTGPIQLIHFSPNPSPNPLKITAAPPAKTSATAATFAFKSSESGVGFVCSLDGADPAQCDSPETYDGLYGGDHEFAVWSVEGDGDVSAEATWDWEITGSPPPPQKPVAVIKHPPDGVTIHAGDTVGFSGSCEAGDNKVTGYSWDFGNGITSTLADPGKVPYPASGSYTASFTCSISGATSDPVTREITVQPADNSGGGSGASAPFALALLFALLAIRGVASRHKDAHRRDR